MDVNRVAEVTGDSLNNSKSTGFNFLADPAAGKRHGQTVRKLLVEPSSEDVKQFMQWIGRTSVKVCKRRRRSPASPSRMLNQYLEV